jgi:hypothetical protein
MIEGDDPMPQAEPETLAPLVRNYLRVGGAIYIISGIVVAILFWHVTHHQGDISPALRAELVRKQQANPHAHPYIAYLFITTIVVYLIAGGVSAIAGKSWAFRWIFAFIALLLFLALLVKDWG